MNSKQLAVLVAVAVVSSGCATVERQPVTASLSEMLSGRTLVASRYPTSNFTAKMESGLGASGLLGAAVTNSLGNQLGSQIVQENDIADPAAVIAAGVGKRLVERRRMILVPSDDATAEDDRIATLITTFPRADYILDVKTMMWMLFRLPRDRSRYQLVYHARIRLIATGSKKVMAESMCKVLPADFGDTPTRDELLDHEAALLRQHMAMATNKCIDVLSEAVLSR
ncbi:MAG TPA: hypothetical protein VEB43_16135 [Anaeromyxobacter sp.]|nr:hypothetical protein [Anaeromyxobacter sp.]